MQDKHVIPYVPVETRVDLWMADFIDLKTPGNAKYIALSSLGKPLGYQQHGIMIFNGGSEGYKCWDATCTDCLSSETHLEIEGTDAVCPNCGTKFSLLYGQPWESNQEIYPLKGYAVSQNGNTLIISN